MNCYHFNHCRFGYYAGKLTNITEGKLFDNLHKAFVQFSNIKFKLYVKQKSNIKKRVANAGVQGFSSHSIIVDQEVIDLLDEEEFLSIMYHEIRHIIGKDDIHETIPLISVVLLPSLSNILLHNLLLPKRLLDVLAIVFTICILFGVLFILNLFRKQEYRCDLFASEKGNPRVLVNALIKLSQFNNNYSGGCLLRELLSTHPSIHKKIQRIKAFVQSNCRDYLIND